MFTRREWSELAKRTINDQLGSIESAIGTGGVGTPKRSQRDAMLGVTQARLGVASPSERGDILANAQSYITGGSSFGLKGSQRRQLGQLAQMTTSGGPDVTTSRPALGSKYSAPEIQMEQPQDPALQQEGFKPGGLIPGQRNDNVGDDTVIQAKKGEYVLPTEVVDYIGVDNIDKEVTSIKKKLGIDPKGHLQRKTGYVSGGEVEDLPPTKTTGIRGARGYEAGGEIEAYIDRGDTGPVQAVQATPQGYTPTVITPEAAMKLSKAWGLDKESPNWNPSYGSQVNTLSPMGRTVQVAQPNAQGIMPGMTLPRGRSIPMGLTQKQFDVQAGEENMLSGMAPKTQGQYLEGKEKIGIDRRKVDLDAELNPARKAQLMAQAEEHVAGAGLKRRQAKEVKSSEKLTDQEKIEARDLSSEERQLRAQQGKLNSYSPTYKQDKAEVASRLGEIRQRKAELGISKAPAEVKTKGPSYQEFVQKVRAAGSKLKDADLKAYYNQKYGAK